MAGASGARRIVLNRAFFDELTLATADGLFELAKKIIEEAPVPDAAPYGEGLVQGGAAIAFVGKKRVGAWSKTGASVKKPRAAKLTEGITVIGGFGFPGRFLETGTVNMPAEPFLTPTLMAGVPDAATYIKAAVVKHRVLAKDRAARGDTYAASRARAKAGTG